MAKESRSEKVVQAIRVEDAPAVLGRGKDSDCARGPAGRRKHRHALRIHEQ